MQGGQEGCGGGGACASARLCWGGEERQEVRGRVVFQAEQKGVSCLY